MVAQRGVVDRRGAIRLSKGGRVALGLRPGCEVLIEPGDGHVVVLPSPAQLRAARRRRLPDRHILRRAEDAADVRIARRRLRDEADGRVRWVDLADLKREFGID